MNLPEICTALPGEAELAGYTILAATGGHPLRRWLLGQTSEYRLRTDATLFTRHAIAFGAIDWCDDRSAIAVWLRQPVPGGWPALGTQSGFEPEPAYTGRITDLVTTLPPAPVDGPHWQLLLLAVEPGARRAGRAAALLAHRLAQLDRSDTTATATTFDETTRTLLHRHGFHTRQQTLIAGEHPGAALLRPAATVTVTAPESP